MKFKTQFTWDGVEMEYNDEASMTQPDMTMSLQELLEKHVRGLDVPTYAGTYQHEDDDFIPNPLTLDLADISEMQRVNAAKIEALRAELQAAQQPKEPDEVDGSSPKQPGDSPQSAEGDRPPESGGQ